MDRDHEDRRRRLERRVRVLLGLVVAGLVLSGVTAFPIETELRLATRLLGLGPGTVPATLGPVSAWLVHVRDAVVATNAAYPFLAYGTDWLAFAHLVIAVAFLGAFRDPVRNEWIVTFGLIASAGIFALAVFAGPVRGIPWFWTVVDCSFGACCGAVLLVCRRDIRELAAMSARAAGTARPSRAPGVAH